MEIGFARTGIIEEHKSLLHRKLVTVALELLLKLLMVVRKVMGIFSVYRSKTCVK